MNYRTLSWSVESYIECFLAARDIRIVKELEDVDTIERQPVNFLCEVNQVDVDGRWYRDDCRIRPGDSIKIRHQGIRLSILSITFYLLVHVLYWNCWLIMCVLYLTSGQTHTLFFKSVRPEHAGGIRFTAERVSSYATLTVKGEPPDTLTSHQTWSNITYKVNKS